MIDDLVHDAGLTRISQLNFNRVIFNLKLKLKNINAAQFNNEFIVENSTFIDEENDDFNSNKKTFFKKK